MAPATASQPLLVVVVADGAVVVGAVAALATGYAYDVLGRRVLAALPVLAGAVPVLAFAGDPVVAVAGCLVWGAAVGVAWACRSPPYGPPSRS